LVSNCAARRREKPERDSAEYAHLAEETSLNMLVLDKSIKDGKSSLLLMIIVVKELQEPEVILEAD